VARGEFSVIITGLAVAAGLGEVGPVATGYVLVLAIVGPLLASFYEPRSSRVLA